MQTTTHTHAYRIQVGFNTGLRITCPRCEGRFVPKRWLTHLVVTVPLVAVCVWAALAVRSRGAALFGWLGIPLVIGGVTWELLQLLLAAVCAVCRHFGVLDRLLREKR